MDSSQEGKFRVIAVDDEDIVLSFVRDALEDEACEVVTAGTGAEALDHFSDSEFDLILSDIRMPGMDGIELVQRVKEIQPNIAVIFITGYADLNSAKDAIKQGAIEYIMKPFELMEIRQAVRNAIKKKMEAKEQSSDHQLSGLSDLHNMLFGAGDRQSLIVSSLRFAMMHQHADHGSVLYRDAEQDSFVLVSIHDDTSDEITLAAEPLASCLESLDVQKLREPVVITNLEDHPIYKERPDFLLEPYLFPQWMEHDHHMVVVPVSRATVFHGMIMLGFDDNSPTLSETTMKFLAITASQLAITLENLSLLEQSQQAYGRLKKLQDETIELEKMAARGQTSAEIGHELNNFLGVIAGNISLLDVNLRKGNYDALDRYIKAVISTIEMIKVFTADLMDLQPISSTRETLFFDRIIREVVEYLTPQRRFRDVNIELLELPDDIAFEADNTQIQQLLYNIFNNAADATLPKGKGQINVTVTSDPVGESFSVSIVDNGVGFEPELLEKAFQERFTTKPDGHGFGLVVCKRIIENHGGELKVDSTPDQGTCIAIQFPRAVAVAEPV